MTFLAIILVGGLLLLAAVTGGSGSGKGRRGSSKRGGKGKSVNVAQGWATIESIAGSGPSGLKNAISEADKLFDYALQQLGAGGNTMGERLKNGRGRFSSASIYDGVWRAHKYRNALAHEVGFDLVASQAKDSLKEFEKGLRDIGAL